MTAHKSLSLKEISVGHLTHYLESLDTQSDSSKRFSKDCISSLFNFLIKTGYLQLNPAHALDPIRVADKTGSRILNRDQVKRIIAKASSRRDKMIVHLLYATGLRRSELCKLKWKDFFDKGITVQMVIIRKGNKSRSVVIKKEIWSELQLLKFENDSSDAFVFQSQKREQLSPSQIFRILKALTVKAKVTGNVSPHGMRHAHATHALEKGARIHLVQKTLGHASVATTGKYLSANPTESSSTYLDFE